MSDCEDSNSDDDKQVKTTNADDEPEEAGNKGRPFASFSMAHALTMVRRRQQEQQRAQQEQKDNLEQERKEKSRAKRQRRRQNQKLARARAKAEAENDEVEDEDEQAICSDEESCDKEERAVDGAEDDVPTQSDAIKSTGDSANLPPKKRIKLGNPTTNLESSSIAVANSSEAQNEGKSSLARAGLNAIKLRSLVPRAVMLKKQAG